MVDKLVARGLVPHVVVAVAEADTAHVLDHDIAHCCPWPGGEVAGFWRGRRKITYANHVKGVKSPSTDDNQWKG